MRDDKSRQICLLGLSGIRTGSTEVKGEETRYNYTNRIPINPPTFGTFFIQVDAPFETIRYCGFEW